MVRIRMTLFILRGQLGWFGRFGVQGLNVLVDFQKKLKSIQSVFESISSAADGSRSRNDCRPVALTALGMKSCEK